MFGIEFWAELLTRVIRFMLTVGTVVGVAYLIWKDF